MTPTQQRLVSGLIAGLLLLSPLLALLGFFVNAYLGRWLTAVAFLPLAVPPIIFIILMWSWITSTRNWPK